MSTEKIPWDNLTEAMADPPLTGPPPGDNGTVAPGVPETIPIIVPRPPQGGRRKQEPVVQREVQTERLVRQGLHSLLVQVVEAEICFCRVIH